jgi:putative nucleotidyltransferase with HDIG domain
MADPSSFQFQIHIVLITDRPGQAEELSAILGRICPVRLLPPACDPKAISDLAFCVVLDVDLSSQQTIDELKSVRAAMLTRSLPCIFVIDAHADERTLETSLRRAKTFGAVNYITRPFDTNEVLRVLPAKYSLAFELDAIKRSGMTGRGVAAAHHVLAQVMEAPQTKRPFSFEEIKVDNDLILDALSAWGIKPWMETVRRHHSRTYKHSLLVTGFAVTLAQKLRIRREDQRRLARAGLLHDIGKAFIPLSILDKPGKLTDKEMDEIKKHPGLGHELLVQQGGFPDEILDCVLHHHEMLDGSGYPEGLKGPQIADLVRIVTIADIFAALIEERAYRQPLPATVAFSMMQQMGSKLDTDLLRAFQVVIEDST